MSRMLRLCLILGLVILAALAAAVMIGETPFDAAQYAAAFSDPSSGPWVVLWQVRAPRAVCALAVGAALGLAGAVMQGLLRNPLADPGVLGVSATAALGAALAIVLGGAGVAGVVEMSALLGAAAAGGLLIVASGLMRAPEALILFGVALSSFAGAATALIFNLSPSPIAQAEVMSWLLGSVQNRSWVDVAWVTPAVVVAAVFAGLSASGAAGENSPPALNVTRSRTCYDQAGAVQAQCDPATTASMRIAFTMSGAHSGDRFTAAVNRTRTDSISGLLGTETSRTHNGTGTSADTLTWSGERGSRTSAETSLDSVINIVFNLPRATNPWPASGTVVRNVSGTVTVTGARDGTRSYQRRVEVVFPADAQGNVTLRVNDKTCTLNLVTRTVTGCS